MENKTEFENYKIGVEAAIADFALMRNECNENGYTEAEYIRIKATIESADWQLRIGAASAEVKGYSDAFEAAAIREYAERGEANKLENAVFTDLFEQYQAELPILHFEGMEQIKRYAK